MAEPFDKHARKIELESLHIPNLKDIAVALGIPVTSLLGKRKADIVEKILEEDEREHLAVAAAAAAASSSSSAADAAATASSTSTQREIELPHPRNNSSQYSGHELASIQDYLQYVLGYPNEFAKQAVSSVEAGSVFGDIYGNIHDLPCKANLSNGRQACTYPLPEGTERKSYCSMCNKYCMECAIENGPMCSIPTFCSNHLELHFNAKHRIR